MTLRPASPGAIAEAAAVLKAGGVVAVPTETVYGLAGDAANPHAVAEIFALKGRPAFNPLIVHVLDLAAAQALATFTPTARALAERFWPGPLTLVLPRREGAPVADLACAGLASIALRVPSHPAARALLAASGLALAAPSANRSGRISPTRAEHVVEEFGDAFLVLDAGATAAGIESTIVAVPIGGPPALLRPGAVSRSDIEAIAGPLTAAGGAITAPGMLASHYAPRVSVRLDVQAPQPGELYLGFGPGPDWDGLNLSPRRDLIEAAANLYAYLRALDARRPDGIAVAPIPHEGLGEAINDRLRRAAAPR